MNLPELDGTGACGVNCLACRLALEGKCSPCGAGTSAQAARKLEAQERLIGAPCPILACASARNTAHCLRDCPEFPCPHFEDGPYPFSDGFLNMQLRRRKAPPPQRQ